MSHPQYEPVPQVPPPWPPQAPARGRNPSRFLPILGVALGLLGLVAGVGAWFRATPSKEVATPAYSDEEVAEAKKNVCDAFELGWRSFQGAGTRKPDNPADPFPATAVNTRLAEAVVANSFFNALSENPAAPKELADLVRDLGNAYQQISLIQLAEGPKTEWYPMGDKADLLIPKIRQLCL